MLILRNTYFSSNTEEGYLLDQKEFNSKAQKNLLGKFYNNVGPKLKDAKVSNFRNEKNIRTLNGKGLTTAADNLKREFQSGGDIVSKIKTRRSKKNHKDELKVRELDSKLTRILGGEKVWNRHLKQHLKGEKNFSQEESLENIYKTILNPIILESDKVYGKKSLYIPRLLENGEIKEGKTLLIGQHPDADLKSDSCYEIFDGLWKDANGKYWIEKSGFLGRKTWEEVEDPKKYMSKIYREFNISSGDLSKVCGNLSKAIYEDSLDNVKGNPQYWKLPKIKYF